ncbi:hypothetical protein [Bradyrhizobium sp. WSM3983]|uniref:hypothetical protein n=1 Tax=Bradyrhizobium sp. WSM3983 TaxID=1038867 RepID=UPI0012EBE80E|nr:hypothetical protein [Bradyrhizobium sp. WSM3983]
MNNQTDFDSAIRRFDPSRPSQIACLPEIAVAVMRESSNLEEGGASLLVRMTDELSSFDA